jgi:hypothetical protein
MNTDPVRFGSGGDASAKAGRPPQDLAVGQALTAEVSIATAPFIVGGSGAESLTPPARHTPGLHAAAAPPNREQSRERKAS